jgi:hypothetical protein
MTDTTDSLTPAPIVRKSLHGSSPRTGSSVSTSLRLLRQPLFWLFLATGAVLTIAAGHLAGHHEFAMGDSAERLYLLDGFDGLEHRSEGEYRWTYPFAMFTVPHAGPGPLTANLTLFDGAPTPRRLSVSLDGKEVYSGITQVGSVPWVLPISGTATSENPQIALSTQGWNPPGDSRTLGVAVTSVEVSSPSASWRAWLAGMALFLAPLLLIFAISYRGGMYAMTPALLSGIGVLAICGGLLAYGDVWLNKTSWIILVLSLIAAALIIFLPARVTRGRRHALWGALALMFVLLLLTLGRFNTGDAEAMYQVTERLLKKDVPWQYSNKLWPHFGLGQSLVNIPFYLGGLAWASVTGADANQLAHFCVSLLNQIITPITTLVLFLGARRRFGLEVALALVGTFLLATPAVPYARLAFAEPLSSLLVFGALMLLWATGSSQADANAGATQPSRGAIIGCGLCLGMAVLVKPANAIYVPLTMLYLVYALTRRGEAEAPSKPLPRNLLSMDSLTRVGGGLALMVVAMLPSIIVTALFNAMRYGSPLVTGYENEGFTTPLLVGLYGLLFSPGKGIIYFAPPVMLAPIGLFYMWRKGSSQARAEALWIGAQAVIVFIFYALWSSWAGNWAWGPRFLVPFVPFMLWSLGPLVKQLWARALWWVLGAGGLVVAIAGTLVDQSYYFEINGVYSRGTSAEYNMLFTPEWSQIVAHWRFLLTGTREAVMRPALEQMGLAPIWDVLVPATFVAMALLCLVMALGAFHQGMHEQP